MVQLVAYYCSAVLEEPLPEQQAHFLTAEALQGLDSAHQLISLGSCARAQRRLSKAAGSERDSKTHPLRPHRVGIRPEVAR